MKHSRRALLDEIGWIESAVEATRLLVETGEGDPGEAARICTKAHAVLRLIAQRLHHLTQEPGVGHLLDPPKARLR